MSDHVLVFFLLGTISSIIYNCPAAPTPPSFGGGKPVTRRQPHNPNFANVAARLHDKAIAVSLALWDTHLLKRRRPLTYRLAVWVARLTGRRHCRSRTRSSRRGCNVGPRRPRTELGRPGTRSAMSMARRRSVLRRRGTSSSGTRGILPWSRLQRLPTAVAARVDAVVTRTAWVTAAWASIAIWSVSHLWRGEPATGRRRGTGTVSVIAIVGWTGTAHCWGPEALGVPQVWLGVKPASMGWRRD